MKLKDTYPAALISPTMSFIIIFLHIHEMRVVTQEPECVVLGVSFFGAESLIVNKLSVDDGEGFSKIIYDYSYALHYGKYGNKYQCFVCLPRERERRA